MSSLRFTNEVLFFPKDKLFLIWIYYLTKGYFTDIFLSLKFTLFNADGFIFEPSEIVLDMEQKIHQGRNVKRFREMLNIKQEALAYDLGEDWNQKKISMLEQKDVIEDSLLKQISAVLKIPVEAFQNFDEEQAINIISNTFNDQSNGYNYYPTFNVNPIEKWIEALEEIKRLNLELLKAKDEQIKVLEKLLKEK